MALVVAIVGLTGAGKSELARLFEEHGFTKVHFGDVTLEELKRRQLPVNEANERLVREELRQTHGMAAYAKLSLPNIRRGIEKGPVVIDGLYSWEEFLTLREEFGSQLKMLAIYSSPASRYQRLGQRAVRPLTPEEARSRDHAEIVHLSKAGPIAMADWTIVNEGDLKELREKFSEFLSVLGLGKSGQ